MNFLTWMFGLGALAIAFPLLFHLIRRTPRGKQTFSSLMFLRESPPKITRKSRLENWLLLLLRSLALILLAIAFMRPFFPLSTQVTKPLGKRVAILVDTSASMRRGSLWQKAVNKVNQLLETLDAEDDVALITFDNDVETSIAFDRDVTSNATDKTTLIRQEMQRLGPTWSRTDLGKALMFAADQLDTNDGDSKSDEFELQVGGQIFVVTDMQEGADVSALSSYTWPKNVLLEVHSLKSDAKGNAYHKLMVNQQNRMDDRGPRVRLINTRDAIESEFEVEWRSDSNIESDDSVRFFVSPGTSQVLPVPRNDTNTDHLVISGDLATFDDRYFVTPQKQQEIAVGFIGESEANDADGLQYYLIRAFSETAKRKINVIANLEELKNLSSNAASSPDLIVVTKPADQATLDLLNEHLKQDKSILLVLTSPEMAKSLETIIETLEVENVSGDRQRDYRMLGQIDFKHPLFKPLSGPQFNDFTKIRFWRHRAVLNLDESNEVIARFDNGDPAIWSPIVENGSILIMNSGWNPEDSQLGLSTKFVPLMLEILNQAIGSQTLNQAWEVDDAIELPPAKTGLARTIMTPSKNEISMAADARVFNSADEPGIYELRQDGQQNMFAVNLNENESRTAPLDTEQLSIYQVRMGSQPTQQEIIDRMQQANNVQIENRQKIWKWAIVAILIVLIVETVLAGRRQFVQQIQPEAAV